MKDSLVIGAVIVVFLTGSGQTYNNKCDDATIDAITKDSAFKSNHIIQQLRDHGDRFVAATANYFDVILSGKEGTFKCAHSVWDMVDDKFTAAIEITTAKNERDGVTIKFDNPRIEGGGFTFSGCAGECPEIVKSTKAYRFYDKDDVIGIYTCNTKRDAATGGKEAFIKVKTINTVAMSEETKNAIKQAKEKAKTLGIMDINDISYDCSMGKRPQTREPAPSTPPAPAPAPGKPWICKFGIILLIIAVVTTAGIIYTSSR